MNYKINQLAKLAGVSTRTLHYYHQIGLLKPAITEENGYRVYGQKELAKLQQILFFRELEFSLGKIKLIINSNDYDEIEALRDQRKLLEAKQNRLGKLIANINQTIMSKQGDGYMSDSDKYRAFNDPTYKQYKQEVEEKWGGTNAYKQSMERMGKLTRVEMAEIKVEGQEITSQLAQLMKAGKAASSSEVQAQIGKFYQYLHHFYDPSLEMFEGLGEMYVADPRFKQTYENVAAGLAEFKRDAIRFYVKNTK